MSFNVTVKTRLVGLLGWPLGHSLSPLMQNAAFQKLGLDYLYLPIEVAPSDLKEVVTGIAKMNFAGYNVTIPHKIHIMEYMDRIDEAARIIGAVNVVSLKDGSSVGCNTDGEGFVRSFEAQTGRSVKGGKFLLLGCGGATRAIAMTLALKEAKEILVCNRTEQKAQALVDEINAKVRFCSSVVPLDGAELKAAAKQAEILVNTTSVGMHPNENQSPVPEDCIHRRLIVADIVYNPSKTRLLQMAEKKGCVTIGGLGMLVYQGAEAFRIWTGVEPPVKAMFAAVLADSH